MNFEKVLFWMEKEVFKNNYFAPDIIFHSLQVSRKSFEIAQRINKRQKVDVNLCLIGGLLHDIGRSVRNDVYHGIEGGKIARKKGFNEKIIRIIERHIGGGISEEEAKKLNLPSKEYLPETIEEKIVCYADKLFKYEYDENNRIKKWSEEDNVTHEIEKLKKEGHAKSAERLKKIANEVKGLL